MDLQRPQLSPAPKSNFQRLMWIAGSAVAIAFACIYTLWQVQADYAEDFEGGNRNDYRDLCWTFSSTTTNTSNGIEGTSIRTGQLTNTTNPHTLGTPCTSFDGTGGVSFTHKVTSLGGSSLKQLDLVLVDEGGNEVDTILHHIYTSTSELTSNPDIGQEGNYTLEWRWIGIGGTGRGVIDNIVVYGENISVPENSCSCGGTLPVRFVSFKARETQTGDVKLDWEVAMESQNKGFEVERAENGQSFRTIGFVEGAGTTQEMTQYSFVDKTVSTQQAFYRLRQIDIDGEAAYSEVIEWALDPTGNLQLISYPNPADEVLHIEPIKGYNQDVSLMLINSRGQAVWETPNMQISSPISISTTRFPTGTYTLKVQQAPKGLVFSKQILIRH